ncbi:hypothetical protein [Sphingomonas sp.]|uniref:hypothetical protein n=1 Tax=Sphingomonas sp. TaxID=28214 RepID=UPI002DD6342E|nr:hypothetical protein [Sphingomonas sp.]
MAGIACLRCGGRLEEGYVIDEGYGSRTPSTWIEGAPEKSFWAGLKTGDRRKLPIDTWRCTRCGLLEQYAPG